MNPSAILLTGLLALGGAGSARAQAVGPEAPQPADEAVATPSVAEPLRFSTQDRNRLTLSFGFWDAPRTRRFPGVYSGAETDGLSAGIEYARYLSEDLAVSLGTHVLPLDAGSTAGPHGVFSGARTVASVLLGVRWNPLRGDIGTSAVKPYVLVGAGPVVGSTAGSGVGFFYVESGARTEVTLGGRVGGGLDFHLGRRWALGIEATYNWMLDFERPVGDHDNYSGPEVRVGFSWLFGKGRKVAHPVPPPVVVAAAPGPTY